MGIYKKQPAFTRSYLYCVSDSYCSNLYL